MSTKFLGMWPDVSNDTSRVQEGVGENDKDIM